MGFIRSTDNVEDPAKIIGWFGDQLQFEHVDELVESLLVGLIRSLKMYI